MRANTKQAASPLQTATRSILALGALLCGLREASAQTGLNRTLVTPGATVEARNLFGFLLDNYGKKIISGAMTLNSMDEPEWLKQNTGKEPALIGIDLMQTGRGYTWYKDNVPGDDAIKYYNRHGIPIICWHWRDPSRKTEEFYTEKTAFDVTKINDANSEEYQAMLKDIDYAAGLLKKVQDAKVPFLWRPLHEAAGGWFWWGKNGPACKKLWQVMYDRMVNHHGLKNIIWVWTKEPNDDAFYPGDAYVDIVGRDYYATGDHSSLLREYNGIKTKFNGTKIVALTECGSIPDPDNLVKDVAGWSWFMPWYGDYIRSSTYNTLDLWKKTMASAYVLTLDEMPDLRAYSPQTIAINPRKAAAAGARAALSRNTLHLKSPRPMESLRILSLSGDVVRRQGLSGTEAEVSLAGLRAGAYVVRIDGHPALRILKD